MAWTNSQKDYLPVTHQKILPTVQSTSFLSDSMLAGAALLSHALEGEKQESKEEKERYKKAAPLDKLLLPSAMCLLHHTFVVSV